MFELVCVKSTCRNKQHVSLRSYTSALAPPGFYQLHYSDNNVVLGALRSTFLSTADYIRRCQAYQHVDNTLVASALSTATDTATDLHNLFQLHTAQQQQLPVSNPSFASVPVSAPAPASTSVSDPFASILLSRIFRYYVKS